jgi:hypothetical protein
MRAAARRDRRAGTADGRFIYRQSAGGIAVLCAYRVSYSAPWN